MLHYRHSNKKTEAFVGVLTAFKKNTLKEVYVLFYFFFVSRECFLSTQHWHGFSHSDLLQGMLEDVTCQKLSCQQIGSHIHEPY